MAEKSGQRRIDKLDRNFAPVRPEGELVWHDIRGLGLQGQGWPDVEHPYDRLPARARAAVRPAVWELSRHSAGLGVEFVTDADRIAARWTLRFDCLALDHMPASAVSGLDLYVRQRGSWRWAGLGRVLQKEDNLWTLVSGMARGQRTWRLYLPLYNGVESARIGVPPGATLVPAPPRRGRAAKPICFYGTSITQGGCASRAGMSYPAILGRRLDRPTINLGFSGNGQAEPEMASLLAELDPLAYVLDFVPNVPSGQLLKQRTGPLVQALRKARPHTPIVLVEHIGYQQPRLVRDKYLDWTRRNAVLRKAYASLTSAGVAALHYVRQSAVMGEDGEATVDGIHPTDVGFLRIADALEPVLRPLVG